MSSREVRLAPPALWGVVLSAMVVLLSACSSTPPAALRGTGDLGVVIERADGKVKVIDPAATDGSEVAVGVLATSVDASLIDREDGILIARHAVVADHALTWPAGLAPAAKATALAQLKAAGVLVRHAV